MARSSPTRNVAKLAVDELRDMEVTSAEMPAEQTPKCTVEGELTREGMTTLLSLPTDVLHLIMLHAGYDAALKVTRSCSKLCRMMVSDNELWRIFFRKRWPMLELPAQFTFETFLKRASTSCKFCDAPDAQNLPGTGRVCYDCAWTAQAVVKNYDV